MATTSQTYPSTSLIPTSTSPSYSSNPAPTNDLGGDDLGNILTTSGSPPLIVAFLAIGLFVVAMVGVFGWRKLSQRRGLDPQPVRTNRRKSVALGKKPVLWDLWARVPGTGNASINIEDTRWENITPFSAVLTFSVPPEQPEEPSPPIKSVESHQHQHHVPFRVFKLFLSAVRRFHLPVLPEPPPPAPPPLPAVSVEKETESRSSDELQWGEASSLNVSVIIAMPTQRTSSSKTSERDTDLEGDEMGEYCIGTMQVLWSEGG